MLALGFDRERRLLQFVNSWGRQWGDNGLGYLPFDYFDAHVTDAWYQFMPLSRCRPEQTVDAFVKSIRMTRTSIGDAWASIELWDMENDIRIGWCFMTLREPYLDVEDLFLRPEFKETSHKPRLFQEVSKFAASQELPLRIWIGHADADHRASNFSVVNDFIRATKLVMRKSPETWAAWVAH